MVGVAYMLDELWEKALPYREKALQFYRTVSANPPRSMKIASSVSGVLLILGGVLGVINIFAGPLGMVISAYNVLFGMLIVCTELKSWPLIKTFQKRVDVYFHLLSVPKGKGFFYCFIGLLAFFASKEWSLSRVCVLVVALVGLLHFYVPIAPEKTAELENPGEVPKAAMLASGTARSTDEADESGSSGCVSALASFAMEVVRDNPEAASAVVGTSLKMAAQNPGLVGAVAQGTTSTGSNPHGASVSTGSTDLKDPPQARGSAGTMGDLSSISENAAVLNREGPGVHLAAS